MDLCLPRTKTEGGSTTKNDVCSVLLECPVCVQVFEDPKVLECGHSLCSNCCEQIKSFDVIVCPVCRSTTQVRGDGLQTNFCLRDLVQHHVNLNKKRKFVCSMCTRACSGDECWLCYSCQSALLCAKCAIKTHMGHQLQEVDELVEKRRGEVNEWRKTAEPHLQDAVVKLRQVQVNSLRIEQQEHTMMYTLRNKLRPNIITKLKALEQEFTALQSAITGVADSAALTEYANLDKYLGELSQKLEQFKHKVDRILKEERDVLNALQNCAALLRVSASVFKASPREPERQPPTPPTEGSSSFGMSPPSKGPSNNVDLYLYNDDSTDEDDDDDSICEYLDGVQALEADHDADEPSAHAQYMAAGSPSGFVSQDLAAMLLDVDGSTDEDQMAGPSHAVDSATGDHGSRHPSFHVRTLKSENLLALPASYRGSRNRKPKITGTPPGYIRSLLDDCKKRAKYVGKLPRSTAVANRDHKYSMGLPLDSSDDDSECTCNVYPVQRNRRIDH